MATAIERQRKYRKRHLSRVRKASRLSARRAYKNNPDKYRNIAREFNAKNNDRLRIIWRRSKLKRAYGLSLEEFDAILVRQDRVCAICKGPPNGRFNSFNVDHCHKTGKIRGLLCFHCNTAIGMAKDSRELLMKMALYVGGD